MFFDQIDTMHKNLQKGLERWLENDLQQRGRTQEKMKQMKLILHRENDHNIFMILAEGYYDTAYRELVDRTCKDLYQKWFHEGGKKEFAISIIIEMIKDQSQLDDEQFIRVPLQRINDWQIIKKLVVIASLMPWHSFCVYVLIVERGLNGDRNTAEEIIADIRQLLNLQFGPKVKYEMTPAIQSIDDLEELKQVFIAAARSPSIHAFREAHPKLQETEETELAQSTQ